jgi:pyrroline-5-carboxylate reductase
VGEIIKGKLLVIGGGAMGEAILAGILSAQKIYPSEILVIEPSSDRAQLLRDRYAIEVIPALDERNYGPDDVCLFAVKPQIAHEVLTDLAPRLDKTLFVSIAIGVTIADYYQVFDKSIPVVRVMPNMPISIGEGVTLISVADGVSDKQREIATHLFNCAGMCEFIPEEWQTAGATISGSGPAYFSFLIDALVEAGVNAGLPVDFSERIAAQTAVGTAKLLLETRKTPTEIVRATASPGGTTQASLDLLASEDVHNTLVKSFAAAIKRAGEIEDAFGD